MNGRSFVAEFVGTFLLVAFACGMAILGDGRFGGALGVALAFGFVLAVLAYALGPISGCHVNPAVTLGMLVTGKTKVGQAIGYWIAQFAGALAGAAVILFIAQAREKGIDLTAANALATNGFGVVEADGVKTQFSPGGYGAAACFIIEILATFILVFTVLMTTDSKHGAGAMAGLIIGISLFVGHLLAINVTNASINPARSFGPAVLVGGTAIAQLWMFIVAPLAGAVVAAVLYMFLRGPATKATAAKKVERLEEAAV
jgi:aquaporin Z